MIIKYEIKHDNDIKYFTVQPSSTVKVPTDFRSEAGDSDDKPMVAYITTGVIVGVVLVIAAALVAILIKRRKINRRYVMFEVFTFCTLWKLIVHIVVGWYIFFTGSLGVLSVGLGCKTDCSETDWRHSFALGDCATTRQRRLIVYFDPEIDLHTRWTKGKPIVITESNYSDLIISDVHWIPGPAHQIRRNMEEIACRTISS